MRIDNGRPIWVVTYAWKDAFLADICFETSLAGLAMMARGGFDGGSIVAIFDDEDEARAEALRRLDVLHKEAATDDFCAQIARNQ